MFVVEGRWDAEMDDAVKEYETSALVVERKEKETEGKRANRWY